jgi:putative methionine-R-sulfoxide reductase with GAF domain
VREHPDYGAQPDSAMRSGLIVPLVRHGRPIGVINVESTRVGGLDIADLERVTQVAAEAAAAAPWEVTGEAA